MAFGKYRLAVIAIGILRWSRSRKTSNTKRLAWTEARGENGKLFEQEHRRVWRDDINHRKHLA
jgi:hypothetical protein